LGPGFSGVWVVICDARLVVVVVVGDVFFGLDWTGLASVCLMATCFCCAFEKLYCDAK
jgi:hypothetical protein